MNPKFRQTMLYFTAVVFGQGLSFLLLPFVTRFLDPEAYGQYQLALTVSNFVGMFGSAWIRNVGLRLYYEADARKGTRPFFLSTSALQAVLFTVLYGATVLVLHLTGAELAPLSVMLAAGVAVLLGDQFAYLVTLLRAEERTVNYAVSEIGAGVLRFVATVGGLYAGFVSPELLFHAVSFSYLIGAAYALSRLWPRLGGGASMDLPGALELVRIGPKSVPFTLGEWLERLADRVILEIYAGTAVVGVYSVGYQIGEKIVASVTKAVFMMAWPDILSSWKEGGREAASRALYEAQRLFAWMTVGPAAFLVLYGDALTRWIAGADYHEAGRIVWIVVISMWIRGYTSYLNRHMELGKNFGRLSTITLIGAVVNVALNFVLIPRYGMTGAALATLANRSFNAVVFFFLRDRELVKVRAVPFVAAGTVVAVSYGISLAVPGGDIAAMAGFVVPYAAVALVFLARRSD